VAREDSAPGTEFARKWCSKCGKWTVAYSWNKGKWRCMDCGHWIEEEEEER
jgi:ribosomal protein S27E